MVYNTVLGIVQQQEDAEEITQDVFLKVYEALENFRGDSQLKTWIYKIAVNKSLDHTRKRKKFFWRLFGEEKEEKNFNAIPDFDHPGVSVSRKEDAAMLFKALNLLPPQQKAAFVLQKLEAQSVKEIAAILDVSEKAAESLLSRANKSLQAILENYYKTNFK